MSEAWQTITIEHSLNHVRAYNEAVHWSNKLTSGQRYYAIGDYPPNYPMPAIYDPDGYYLIVDGKDLDWSLVDGGLAFYDANGSLTLDELVWLYTNED